MFITFLKFIDTSQRNYIFPANNSNNFPIGALRCISNVVGKAEIKVFVVVYASLRLRQIKLKITYYTLMYLVYTRLRLIYIYIYIYISLKYIKQTNTDQTPMLHKTRIMINMSDRI